MMMPIAQIITVLTKFNSIAGLCNCETDLCKVLNLKVFPWVYFQLYFPLTVCLQTSMSFTGSGRALKKASCEEGCCHGLSPVQQQTPFRSFVHIFPSRIKNRSVQKCRNQTFSSTGFHKTWTN